jgi:hypothetical protein
VFSSPFFHDYYKSEVRLPFSARRAPGGDFPTEGDRKTAEQSPPLPILAKREPLYERETRQKKRTPPS